MPTLEVHRRGHGKVFTRGWWKEGQLRLTLGYVQATAVMYMKRFFLYNTVMDYHPKDILQVERERKKKGILSLRRNSYHLD